MVVVQSGHGTPGLEAIVTDVTWSKDGKRVLTGCGDETVILWDATSGRHMRKWWEYCGLDPDATGAPEPITPGYKSSVAMSPDGLLVAFCSRDRAPVLCSTVTGEDVRHRIPGGENTAPLALAFSGDSRFLVCGGEDGNIHLHDQQATERKSYRKLAGMGKAITALQTVPDKPEFYVGDESGTVRRWTYKGRALGVFEHDGPIKAIACSADGKLLLCATASGKARLWRTAKANKPLLELAPDGNGIRDADLSSDGKQIVFVTKDGLARLYDAESGAPGRIHREESRVITNAAFSPDGDRLLISTDLDPLIVDVTTGKRLTEFPSPYTAPVVAFFTPDQHHLTIAYSNAGIHTWNLLAGTRTTRHDLGQIAPFHGVSISHDGRLVSGGQSDGRLRILDQHTGKVGLIEPTSGHGAVTATAFLRGDKDMVVGYDDGTVERWNLQTKELVKTFERAPDTVLFLRLSQNGKRLLGGTTKANTTVVWSVETGQIVLRLKGEVWGQCGAITPDGSRVFTRPEDLDIVMTSVSKNQPLKTFPNKKQLDQGHEEPITCVALSPDGKQLFTGAWDQQILVWDVKKGTYQGRMVGHVEDVSSIDISPDGRFLVSTSVDRTVRFWDVKTRKQLCTLVTFPETHEWAVFDPEGRYDGSNNGRVPQIHFVAGLETYGIDQLRRQYYEPGLLAKHLGYAPDALTSVGKLPPPTPAPKLATNITDPANPVLEIKATGQGGGVGQIEVRLNGKQILDDARGGTVSRGSKEEGTSVELAGDPRLLPGRKNTVETIAWNTEGTTSARGFSNFNAPGEPIGKPHLYAILCGVSDYTGTEIDLKFAAKDARDFGAALQLAGEGAFGADRVHVTVLTSGAEDGETPATRENLRRAFEALAVPGTVTSEDIFVVYLSGHGRTYGKKKDKDYYYLCADAESEDLSDPTTRQSVAVSSNDLLQWIAAVPSVHRQLMVLDTCAAGRVRDELRGRMGISSTQRLALGEVSEKTGMFVLAGCAADQVSYESSQFGQGLLTYALLFGMSCGCDFKEAERIDARRLVNFAQELVPQLAQVAGLSSIQKPVKAEQDESFEVGSLTPEERARIRVQKPKPVLIRSSFQRERPPRDTLGFSGVLDEAVKRFEGATGGAATTGSKNRPVLVFADTTRMRDAYSLSGRYRRAGKEMLVMVGIYHDGGDEEAPPIAEFEITGPMDTPEQKQALAARLLETAYKEHILAHHQAKQEASER
jgi:WD40 repeat protein